MNEHKKTIHSSINSTWEKVILISLMVAIATFTYLNHFNNPFEFDDDHTILTNENIRKLENIPNFFIDATTTSTLPMSQAYRPGLTTLNAIDYWIGGKDKPVPFYYHLSIFIGFMLLGILMVFLIESIFKNYFNQRVSLWLSVFAATWFCVHTANAETINYIIARADSFSTMMLVMAMVIYIYLPKLRRYYLYMIPIIIGFLVKEPVVMFVPILWFYSILFEQKRNLSEIRLLSKQNPLFVALKSTIIPTLIIILLFVFSRMMTPDHWSGGGSDPLYYLLSQPYVILHYFNNFILPFNLVVDTDWTLVQRIFDDRVIIGFLFLSLVVYVILTYAPKHPPVAFGLIWFILALLPTSSIFPLAEVLNDHRPFFPYIGLIITFTYLAGLLYNKLGNKSLNTLKKLWMVILLVVLGLHILGTRQRNEVWSSEETLWRDATIKAPNNGRVWMNYGNTQLDKMNLAEAEMAYNKAKILWPYYSYIYLNLGVLYLKQNKFEEAEANFKYSISCDSLNPESYFAYADFLFRQNRMIECSQVVETGLQLSANHEKLLALKASVDPFLVAPDKVLETKLSIAEDNVKKSPTPENYLQLSLEYYNLKRFYECIEACNKALQLKPDYDLAYNNICSSYIQLGEWDLAINACEKGLKISPHNELLNGNLKLAQDNKSQSNK